MILCFSWWFASLYSNCAGLSGEVKTPKLYWMDIGIWRHLSGFRGELSGPLFETMVVGELVKWVRTRQREVDVYFYRTRSGNEVDLLLETSSGIIGIEIKSRASPAPKDLRPLKWWPNTTDHSEIFNQSPGCKVHGAGRKIKKGAGLSFFTAE